MKIIPYLKFDQSLLASAAASFTQIVFIHAEYYKVYFKEKLSPIWLQIIKLYKICCCRDKSHHNTYLQLNLLVQLFDRYITLNTISINILSVDTSKKSLL